MAVTVALMALPAGAAAQRDGNDRPEITRDPKIRGEAVVGKRLEAYDAHWRSDGPTTVRYGWFRCDTSSEWSCDEYLVSGPAYTLTAADRGKRIRVALLVGNADGWDYEWSDATSVVAAPPPPPPPPPPPVDPDPNDPPPADPPPADPAPAAPAPATPAAPVTGPGPGPAVSAPAAGDVRAKRLRSMKPAPIVRIRGWLTRAGAQISLLSVRAPRGAQITVRCLGRGCPRERWGRATIVTRVKAFEGVLRAGVRLVVLVTRPGFVGKHTVIQIRRGKAPTRRDRCVYPGTRRPQACRPAD